MPTRSVVFSVLVLQKIALKKRKNVLKKVEKLRKIYGKNCSEIVEICTKVVCILYSCGLHILLEFYLQNISNKAEVFCLAAFGHAVDYCLVMFVLDDCQM